MLYATVRNRKIHVKKPDTVVQNGVKVDWLQLEMDDEWAAMDSIVCVFVARYTEEQTGDGGAKTLVEQEIKKEMLHTFGQKVLVPWEVLVNSGMLSVSCTGYVGSEKIMTTMYPDSFWEIVQNGPKSGDSTIEPTPSLYDQIVAAAGTANAAAIAATQAREQLLQDKANGVFDGADGQAATVEVGTVITGSPEENAQVYATGTPQEVRLNFVIPRGKQGPVGQKGDTGPIGKTGPKGDPGPEGQTGPKGDPFTYSDFTQEQLASLKGDKGEKGDTGPSGADGKSAYLYAVDGGYTGTEDEFKEKMAAEIPVVDNTLTQIGQAADAAKVGEELRSLSGKIANLPTAPTRTFKTQAIGELFDQPESYTAWCSGSLHYDDKLGKFVDLLYAAPKHENPEYTANFVTHIDPKTYEATTPVLCKYYDTDGITELTITNAGRPAFVILQDGSYMMLQTIGSVNYRFISTDYGLTWVKGEQITGYSGSTETYALVQLSNGRLLANAISRVINYSDDNGITWTSVTPVTSGASYEAEYCFLEVKSGVVLGICRKTVGGVGRAESGEAEHAVITVSEDYGTTWSDLKESETIDNMNASTCTGYIHDGIVEIFAASRWYNNGDYAVTDYVNTGKSGAITHYVATIENSLKDKFTKLGITVYAKTMGNATTLAAQDFHTPCIAVNGDDMLMVYFDRIAPYNISDQVNHYYVRGSLVGIDYGVRDDLKSTVFPYSSVQIEKLLKKQYNELIVKINEAIMSGEVIPPGGGEDGDPTSYILDGIVANFNFVDASKVDATAKTVTDTINGIVATCTSETFPEKRDNSLGRASYTVPAVSDYYGSTSISNGFSVEICVYRYDGDGWSAYGLWWTSPKQNGKHVITCDSSQASIYTYIDTESVSHRTKLWWGSAATEPIPSGTLGFVHIVVTYDVNGTLTVYKNGEALKTITPTDFSAWDSTLVTDITSLSESMKTYRIYNRALTAEEVASNYKYELSTIV